MVTESTLAAIREFWRLMSTNDFAAVSAVLADDFVLEWPQSRELIRGAANFARLNQDYPGGPWAFTVNRLVAGDAEAASDVLVSDGSHVARAISFSTLVDGKVRRIVEFWPAPYEPPYDRSEIVEPLE